MKRPVPKYEDPKRVRVAKPLVGHSLSGRTKRLVVSLAGVGRRRGGVQPMEFVGTASAYGDNHVLFLSDTERSWMNAPGQAEKTVSAITGYRDKHGIDEVVTLGNSMGGFAALVLPDLMRIDVAIAFAPQFSAHHDLVPEETRWTPHRDKITDWPYPTVGQLDCETTKYFIFHGDAPDEVIHWQRFPKSPELNHFIFEGGTHNIARLLQKRGRLAEVINLAIARRSRAVRKTLQRAFLGRRNTVLRREDYEDKHQGRDLLAGLPAAASNG